jgi:uncharacterized protein with PQ loop repeat
MKDIYKKVQLFKNDESIFLVNMSSVDISTLEYLSYSIQVWELEDGHNQITSSRPVFEIRDIPSQTYMELEKINIYEDGAIIRYYEKIVWANGIIEEHIHIPYIKMVYKLKRTGTVDLNLMTKISREQILIREEPSIVRKLEY